MKYKKELSKLHYEVQDLYHKLGDDYKKKFNLRRKLDIQLLTVWAFHNDYLCKYLTARATFKGVDDAFKALMEKWESKYSNG